MRRVPGLLLVATASGCSMLFDGDKIPFIPADACVATCSSKPCGTDNGCGQLCVPGTGCACVSVCTGKPCGTGDGCGAVCMPTSSDCDCTPSCVGKTCGTDNGCGAQCALDAGCTCSPSCGGKPCGTDDGCGVACMPGNGCLPANHRASGVSLGWVAPPEADAGRGDGGTRATLDGPTGAAEGDLSSTNYRAVGVKVHP